MYYLQLLIKILVIVVPLLISVAYFTLAERKILGAIQRRRGPNVQGFFGLTQPLSDGFKLLVKEAVMPSSSNSVVFLLSPMLTFIISIICWSMLPYSEHGVFADVNIGLLYILGVSSLGIYGIIMSGWSSNSKYAFLGALRSAAQMVSYEVSIGFIIATIALCSGSFSLNEIIYTQSRCWFVITFFPLFLIFFACGLAETNRHPFDLPEAEAELVSGYNVEYSSMKFALFSLGEYSNMLLMSAMIVSLFFGGWNPIYPFEFLHLPRSFWFGLKVCIFVILYVIMRAALPRYRYDQLMSLGWNTFVPITLAYFLVTYCILVTFNI